MLKNTLKFNSTVPMGADGIKTIYRGYAIRQASRTEYEVWYEDTRRASGKCVVVFKTYAEATRSIDAYITNSRLRNGDVRRSKPNCKGY